jgi:hypothetical protein
MGGASELKWHDQRKMEGEMDRYTYTYIYIYSEREKRDPYIV